MKKELKREVCGEMASLALNKSHGEDRHLLHNATSSSSSDINRSLSLRVTNDGTPWPLQCVHTRPPG